MEIDVRRRAGEISPLWFGHNLEHTRRCLWQGLSAQLIRNRKFAAGPGSDGVARHWYRIGPSGTCCLMERTFGRWGEQGEAFVTRYDATPRRRDASMQRQRIEAFAAGARCGIGQAGIFLARGGGYEGVLALSADRALSVRVRVLGGDAAVEYVADVEARAGEWSEHRFEFTASTADADARLEITFDGPGMLCVGMASLLPAGHFLGMRPDVIALLKEIAVPILRWPGGNFAGSYRWKDGLLPVERRAPLPGGGILPDTNGYDDHEIGTDEFMALCRELGAEPWITINMSIEGPEDAAAWVEYCNGAADTTWGRLRADRGHPEPYRVRHWSLGNEMGYGHMRGPNAPEEYGEAAVACARAMRAVDPTIELFASGAWWQDEWYATALASIGDCCEHISYHEYTALIKDFEGERGRAELRRLASAGNATLAGLEHVRKRLDDSAPAGKFLGISFDEWNVWHTWFRVPGVAEAIYVASMLNMFCRSARKVGMTTGAYFEPVNEGAILVEPGSARLTPAGRVFSFFRAHHGNELIETEAPPAETPLDIAASVNDAERELTVTLVNADPDAERPAEIAVAGVNAIAGVKGDVLRSPDFLPQSRFVPDDLDVAVDATRAVTLVLPPLSVARLGIRYR